MVTEVTSVTPEIVEALGRLIPQLSSSAPSPTAGEVAEIATSPATVLLAARDGHGRHRGIADAGLFRAPTGPRAWIEDVVVDTSTRGQGIGAALVREALDRATGAGARTVDLTSRPSREAANRLYVRLGFEQRATNVYRWNRPDDRRAFPIPAWWLRPTVGADGGVNGDVGVASIWVMSTREHVHHPVRHVWSGGHDWP